MSRPTVTVVVPVFNRLDLVGSVLDAFAQQQTTIPFEVVVVDDGSEPSADGVVEGRDLRFRMLRQPNRGRSCAINAGLKVARGQILIVCDSDIVPTSGFIDEHAAFHAQNQAVEDTHLGGLDWGISPTPIATLLGPRANPRMMGLKGPVPWTLWYTDNWSFKRQLWDAGIVSFDGSFRVWGWEDLELGHRLAAQGVRNIATSSGAGLHLQGPTLDGMLAKFATSVPNLLHLATCVGPDDTVARWLSHRCTWPLMVDAGEAILRGTVGRLESVAEQFARLESSLSCELRERVSHAVFRCGMQRGFLRSGVASPGEMAGNAMAVETAILPHADLVRTAYVVLQGFSGAAAANDFAHSCIHMVNAVVGDRRVTELFVNRIAQGSRSATA